MTGNYRATVHSGRVITAKANGKLIEVFGVTIARVNETFWEPDSMFRQMLTEGVDVIEDDDKVEEVILSSCSTCLVAH